MYFAFFGVERCPFAVSPDPDCLYAPAQYRDALSGLSYGILNRKGFLMLTGDAGTGKTTLCARVTSRVPSERMQATTISNPTVPPEEFLELLLWGFGHQEIPHAKVSKLIHLNCFLKSCWEQGKVAALIIDEAHLMPVATLEEVRMLGNLCQDGIPLLQIVFSGQNQLIDLFNRDDLRQLKQRIAVRVSLEALSQGQIGEYMQFRWRRAGASRPCPFTAEATACVATLSQGVPRVVNTLCDNALLFAFAEESLIVTAEHVRAAAKELCIEPPAPATAPRSQPTKAESGATAVGGNGVIPRIGNPVFELQTLNRYLPPAQPLLARLARKLGFAQA